jgi:uncharacterized protein (DUF983 family)
MSSCFQIPICPFAAALKHDCPTCGVTRALFQIGSGNFLAAFSINPVAYVVLAAFIRHGVIYSCPSFNWLKSTLTELLLLVLFFTIGFLHSLSILPAIVQ